ncbi:hypothetical protein ACFXA2_31480, partial [Micromonospora chalcea]
GQGEAGPGLRLGQFADGQPQNAVPVPALAPGPWLRHPAVTVTVADPAALRDAVTADPADL